MRQVSGVIGPSVSPTRSWDTGLLSVPTPVTPRRSRTTASYCRFKRRGIWEVAGIPGTHLPGSAPGALGAPAAPETAADPPAAPFAFEPGTVPEASSPASALHAAS